MLFQYSYRLQVESCDLDIFPAGPCLLQAIWLLTSGGPPIIGGDKGICHAVLVHRLFLPPHFADWPCPRPVLLAHSVSVQDVSWRSWPLAAFGQNLFLSQIFAESGNLNVFILIFIVAHYLESASFDILMKYCITVAYIRNRHTLNN